MIFPVKMWNLVKFRNISFQLKGPPKHYVVLTGIPPVLQVHRLEGGRQDRRELG